MTPDADTADQQVDHGLPPWQFFLLCGMLGATAVVIIATGQPISNILILSVTIVAASFVGLGAYRILAPLVAPIVASAPVVSGGRTRAGLEREKTLVLRSIKELEFDRAMGKVAQADFDEMGGRLRRRAIGLMQQLDAETSYREQIEKELASLVAVPSTEPRTPNPEPRTNPELRTPNSEPATRSCSACGTANDTDARFCKQCGTSLTVS